MSEVVIINIIFGGIGYLIGDINGAVIGMILGSVIAVGVLWK